jgi:hypothetical protein
MAQAFTHKYHQHCAVLMDAVSKMELSEVPDLMIEFWTGAAPLYTDLLVDPHVIDVIIQCDVTTFEV